MIVKKTRVTLLVVFFLTSACMRKDRSQPDIAPDILSEVNRIGAIDNHAHPVRFVGAAEPDREFDALPVDNMEPASDPLALRPGDPAVLAAWKALWNYPYDDLAPQHVREWKDRKQQIAK